MSRKIAVGIDLGSTQSEISIMEHGEPTVIVSSEGSRTFPSVISIDEKGERKKQNQEKYLQISGRNPAIIERGKKKLKRNGGKNAHFFFEFFWAITVKKSFKRAIASWKKLE